MKKFIFVIFLSFFCLGCVPSDSDVNTSVPTINLNDVTYIYTINLSYNSSSKIIEASVYKNGIIDPTAIVNWTVTGNATYSTVSINQIKLNFTGSGLVFVTAKYKSVFANKTISGIK